MPLDMKQVIADQLTELLRRKSLDKVTVTELVEACDISRQTFYYHFRDLMDVLEWQHKQVLDQAVCNSLAAPDLPHAARGLVDEAFANRELLEHLMTSGRRAEIERMMVQSMEGYLAELLRRRGDDKALSPSDALAVLRFYASGIVGLIVSALADRDTDRDALARQLQQLVSGQLAPC